MGPYSELSFGPHFAAFGLLRIQSECGEMQTKITPNTDTFYAVLDIAQDIAQISV